MPSYLDLIDSHECLSQDVIADLHQGRLSSSQLEKISTHISYCTRCQSALSEFHAVSGSDPFAAQLKKCLELPDFDNGPALLAMQAAALEVTLSKYRTGPFVFEDDGHGPNEEKAQRVNVGPYVLQERIGRGGMGVVYKAKHERLGRTAAVKMIRSVERATDRVITRFHREAEAISRLDHPNVVRLFDFGEQDGLPYFAMEWVSGGTLSEIFKAGAMPIREAVTLIHTLSEAMAYAHDKGVVHRDLKPSNVLLSHDGAPKIADFGLAKLLDDEKQISVTGGVMGTPNYMSPEQAAGRPSDVGPHTDVYALGVLLFEALTGLPPFKGEDQAETMRKVREETAPDLSTMREGIPRELEAICQKCLEKSPLRRYTTARLLANDLERWLNNLRPLGIPGAVTRTTRKLWRHRVLTATGILLFVAVTAGAMAAIYLDPDRELRKIQSELAKGNEVTLIGVTGAPKWYNIVRGEKGTKITTADDGTFQVHAVDMTMIELLPSVPFEAYRFEMMIRHEKSNMPGGVGLYLGRKVTEKDNGKIESFTQLSFNDVRGSSDMPLIIDKNGKPLKRPQNSVHMNTSYLIDFNSQKTSGIASGISGPLFIPAGEEKEKWHQLSIRITSSDMIAEWDNQPFQISIENMIKSQQSSIAAWETSPTEKVRMNAQFANSIKTDFTKNGSLGIYLSRGSASFTSARIRNR